MSGKSGFLLDTNVISEATRPRPDAKVMTWLASADEDRLFLSVATLAEISRGIEAAPAGRKKSQLRAWLFDELVPRFDQRILPVDAAIGVLWGAVTFRAAKAGHDIEAVDALLAATAEHHHLTLATRNVADFAALKLAVINPWDVSR
jgi:toxin FitB